MRSRGSICLVLALAACGPRQIALDGGESGGTVEDTSTTEATSSSTTSSSSTGEPDPDTATDTSTDESSEDPSSGFVPDYDLPPPLDCSVFDQDCPEDYKCVPWLNPSPSRCVPVLGDHGVGEPCEIDYEAATDDCDANSHCWGYNDDEPPYTDVCRPLCIGTADDPSCPGEGESCISYRCHILGQIGIPLCELNCDPLAQACGEGLACSYFYSYFGCGVVDEANQVGEVCEWSWDCAPGLHCVAAELLLACDGPSCCTPYCAFGDDQFCADQMPGTVCTALPVFEPVEDCPVHGMCALPEG